MEDKVINTNLDKKENKENQKNNKVSNKKTGIIIGAAVAVVLVVLIILFAFKDMLFGKSYEEANLGDTVIPDEICQYAEPVDGEIVAWIYIKDYGTIKVKFFETLAPKAVENFITHAKDGYYDGLIFHRVMDNFMIQGGDPQGTGQGGESIWGSPFEDEFSKSLMPIRGALCMANSGSNTNGSQFFIVKEKDYQINYVMQLREAGVDGALVDYFKENGGSGWLYGVHTVFGQVYEGMDVVDSIASVSVNSASKPTSDVVIEKIEIRTYEK